MCLARKIAGDVAVINVLESDADIPEFVSWVKANKKGLGCDTETTGLDWWADDFRLRLVQFGNATEAYVVPVELSEALLAAAVGAIRYVHKLVFQNGTYDLLVLDASTNLAMEEVWPKVTDTKILAHLVDSRGVKDGCPGHSLEALTGQYIDSDIALRVKGSMAEIAKSLKTTKAQVWKEVDTFHPGYLTYAGLDPILAYRLAAKLKRLVPASARKLISFEHKVAEVCSYMSRRGFLLDVEYTEGLARELEAQEAEWTQVARDLGCENPWSTDQCAEALRDLGVNLSAFALTKTGKLKVDGALLDKVRAPEYPDMVRLLAGAIDKAKSARKKRQTWLRSFLDLRDAEGRVHPAINSIQARTARQSITGVPAQTLPSGDWEIRRCFVADEGHIALSTDYSNMELRFLAAHGGDKTMLRAFKNGDDLHQITADAAGVPRKAGKTTNFCVCFGGGWKAVHEQAGVTEELARKAVEGFWETYPGVKRLAERLTEQARRFGHIETASGRRLYVDRNRAYSALNYFIQSGSRDITCRALVRMHESGLTPYMRLPIHDEVVFSVPEEHGDKAMKLTADLMAETIKGLEIPTDPDRGGRSWGSLYFKDLKTATANDPYYQAHPEQAEIDLKRRGIIK
ncbi:DNA polymerase [Streptomyces yunnanensis]|uniref:DNA polymerase I n=1 Tax=Streptomyces yunnanensis TaxID=156453 RepID=A0ABY8A1E5_9ACTN|nr:DNA polymerase [Streptomyces yunnanensis]WEB38735.1 DNA polymerase [Streptomyces yunnanensis]